MTHLIPHWCRLALYSEMMVCSVEDGRMDQAAAATRNFLAEFWRFEDPLGRLSRVERYLAFLDAHEALHRTARARVWN